ncbi:MAG: TIGR01777 family oxidoreductase [Bacteroidia bacterium]|nr:TIGR01777 family oxidoreductase [Bacteroidia bacterium]
MRKVLLTGGTGLIGQALIPALRKAGYEPLVLTRQAPQSPAFIQWDGRHIPPHLSEEKIEAVINLAGANIAARRWTETYKRELWESRVELTHQLSQWMQRYVPQARLLSASAVGYYGHTLSMERLAETSPPGTDFLAGLAQAWEKAAQEASPSAVILRLGVVLARTGGAWIQLRRAFWFGIGSYFLPGVQGFSWVHLTDVVRAFLWIMEQPAKTGVYNLTAPQPVSAKELAEVILRRKKGLLLVPIPESALRFAFGEMALTLTRGVYAVPQRLLSEGFSFTYPTLDEAVRDLLP